MDKAILELSDKLRHPSDINTKLESVLKTTKDSKELYEHNFNNKLQACYRSIKDLSEGISQMSNDLESLKITKNKSISILNDFTNLIKDYKTIKLICQEFS